MKLIAHRINTIAELIKLPHEFGVELDIRDNVDGRLYLSHDPFVMGEDFEEYLRHYNHGLMIVNVKSERVEWNAVELLKKHGVKEYFFLDSSFPMIYSLINNGCQDIALRYSEYEGLDTIRTMAGHAKWVWVDTFNSLPLTEAIADELHNMGYKICLVSPELQGKPEKIDPYISALKKNHIYLDAVCGKSQVLNKYKP